MRILIPVLGFGRTGGNRVLAEFASAWVRAGHDVRFLTHATAGLPYFPTIAPIVWSDTRGRLAEAPPAPASTAGGALRFMRSLRAGTSRIGPDYDVILANHSLTTWPIWLARTGSARLFYYVQAYEPEYYRQDGRRLNQLLSALSYRLPFRQIVNGPLYLGYRGIRADTVVPFGIDLATFTPKEPPQPLAGAARVVLGCIGRSEPGKGTRYVLEAFEALWARDSRYRLRVAYGNLPDGWSHPACEIVTPANDRELAGFYRSLDILVAAGTVQHGAPHYPVLEAMASGTAVVTTGYMPADSSNSWLARNEDSASLAEQVEKIVFGTDHAARVARAIDAVQPFAWDLVAARMLERFERP